VWAEVRIWTEADGLYRVVPVTRPEVVAEYAGPDGGYTEIIDTDRELIERHVPAAIGEADPPNQPVTLLVAPPPRALIIKKGDMAWM
jgi:hypothetical protein